MSGSKKHAGGSAAACQLWGLGAGRRKRGRQRAENFDFDGEEGVAMDSPIEKKALFAQTRVQQALEAGAHYIDADDVRDLIGEYERALKSNRDWVSSLRSQIDHNVTVNGMVIKICNALRDSNNELKQQLAEARLALDSSEKRAAALRSQLDCALHAIEKGQEQEVQSAKPEFPKRTMVSDDGRLLEKKTSAGRAYENHIAWL